MVAGPSFAVELSGSLAQGGLVIGHVAPGSVVRLDGEDVSVDEQSGVFSRKACKWARWAPPAGRRCRNWIGG